MTSAPSLSLSIITVVYRDPIGLAKTLASLREIQKTEGLSWEHIVVDSSPEQHGETLGCLPGDWPLLYIPQSPSGIYAAMNEGILKARGEYLWFLNAGDELTTAAALGTCLQSLQDSPGAALAVANADLYREDKFMYRHRTPGRRYSLLGINRICHQAVIYRANLFTGPLREFDLRYKLAADYAHHLRVSLAGLEIVAVREALVKYDMGGQSATNRKVLDEFALVHEHLRPLMSASHFFLQRVSWRFEKLRLALFDQIKASRWAKPLGNIRLKWKRATGSNTLPAEFRPPSRE